MKTEEEIIAQDNFQELLRNAYEDEREYIQKWLDKDFGKVLRKLWFYFKDDYTCTYPKYESRTVALYEAFWEQIKNDFPKPAPKPKKVVKKSVIPAIPTKAQIDRMRKLMDLDYMYEMLDIDWDSVYEYLKEHWNDEI